MRSGPGTQTKQEDAVMGQTKYRNYGATGVALKGLCQA